MPCPAGTKPENLHDAPVRCQSHDITPYDTSCGTTAKMMFWYVRKLTTFFSKCPSQEKLTPNAQKELAQARVTRLARKETIRDSKKRKCFPYSRPLHIYKAMSCPRLPETSIFGETDQYVTIIQCCVTQTVQQNNEARKHKYCMGFHIHACYHARIKICHKSH